MNELRQKLLSELKSLEENRNYEFNSIPGNLGQLQLIAFVQDDTSKEVLQSVSGEVMTFSNASPLLAPAPSATPQSETKATEKSESPAEKPANPDSAKPDSGNSEGKGASEETKSETKTEAKTETAPSSEQTPPPAAPEN